MLSVQLGAALSVGLFPAIGTAGTAWLRLTFGAVIFLVWARPPFRSWSWRDVRTPVGLGVVTGFMTISFLVAIDHLPLGTAVAIEFLGPLTVAAVRAHSRAVLVWPLLALVGVLQLGEGRAVGRQDLLGERDLGDAHRLAELHRAALELAQGLEHLLGGALLDLGGHGLRGLAPDLLAEAERGASGVAQGQGGQARAAGDGAAGEVGHAGILSRFAPQPHPQAG